MVLYELKDFDTNDDLERKRVERISSEFVQQVNQREEPHTFYAITLSTRERYVREHIGWWNFDARERFVDGLFSSLIHRISSKCCSNYKRDIHKNNRCLSLGFIEHHSRTDGLLTQPHIHATIAVSPEWDDRFQSCLTKNPCRDHYSLNHEMFSGNAIEQWHNKVSSLRLQHLPTSKDKYRWMSYCVKQLDTDYQGVGSFIHSGLREKRVG